MSGKKKKFFRWILHLRIIKGNENYITNTKQTLSEKKNHKSSDGKTCLHAAERFFHLLVFSFLVFAHTKVNFNLLKST